MTFFDRENDRLAREIVQTARLIKHGKNTGQRNVPLAAQRGLWVSNLEIDLELMLDAYCEGFEDERTREGALLRIQIEDASRVLREA